ncbi:MAG: HAMP domain-containing protein [Ardenticatenaceae bacterium]
MRFKRSLQSRLTFSHLAVTVITVLILELLIFGGYVLYLRSDTAAFWAGEQAAFIASEIAWQLDHQPLNRAVARQYILSDFFVSLLDEEGVIVDENGEIAALPEVGEWVVDEEGVIVDENGEIAALAEVREWVMDEEGEIFIEPDRLILFDPNGRVVASNNENRYPAGTMLDATFLPGFDEAFLDTIPSISNGEVFWEEPELLPMHYTVVGNDHIGQSVIVGLEGEVLGGVYIRVPDVTLWLTSGETLQVLGFGLLCVTIIATLVSGVTGSLLARSFGRRFAELSAASAALADGDLDQRVPVKGNDEIDQLSMQFNGMADQIGNQMLELRQLAERNALLAQEARALAALEERQRLARDLHDALKQQLFGLSLTAGSIRQLMVRDQSKAGERLTQLAQQTRDIYIEMDRIIHQLRPAALEDRGLAAALPELVTKWQTQHDLPVELEIKAARELSLVTEQALYRVCQEALNNIARHANASQVTLLLQYELDEVILSISDDGSGFDQTVPRPARAMGIRGMQERMTEIGGCFTIESRPEEGTTIIVTVPARLGMGIK